MPTTPPGGFPKICCSLSKNRDWKQAVGRDLTKPAVKNPLSHMSHLCLVSNLYLWPSKIIWQSTPGWHGSVYDISLATDEHNNRCQKKGWKFDIECFGHSGFVCHPLPRTNCFCRLQWGHLKSFNEYFHQGQKLIWKKISLQIYINLLISLICSKLCRSRPG